MPCHDVAAGLNLSLSIPPPIKSGLVGWYTGHSFDTSTLTWRDISGSSNHASVTSGSSTVSLVNQGNSSAATWLNGQPVVTGTPSSRLWWPLGVLPAVYTLFHVARWNGGSTGRSKSCCCASVCVCAMSCLALIVHCVLRVHVR